MSEDITSLRSVPGIGEKMAKRFIEHFGSESLALEAILRADIAGISQVEGVGQRYAISLVHDIRSRAEGVDISDFLKTREALDVYDRLLELIADFAHTTYARDKLHMFIPYPSKRSDIIMQMRSSVSGYMETAKLLADDKEIVSMLTKVKPLNLRHTVPKVRDRVIVTADQDTFEYSRGRFGYGLDVQLAGSLSEFVDISRGYSYVTAANDTYMSFDLPEEINPEFVPDITQTEDWEIIPEKEIIAFSKNLGSLQCAIGIVRLLRSKGISFMDAVPDGDLEELASTLSLIDTDGNIIKGTDEEVDRLRYVIENLDPCVTDALKDANSKFDECLVKSEFTLGGQDMLKVMKGSMELKDLLGKKLHTSYHSVMKECMTAICSDLSLENKETLFIDSLFPEEIGHPVEIDREQLSSFRQHLERKVLKRQLEHKREVARVLSSYLEVVRSMVREVLDFDVGFAIGCFAMAHNLEMPDIVEGPGIGFDKGRNLFIASRHGDVVPIDYSLGKNSYGPDADSSRVILLSGVNSGGKTSMLELIAQSLILTHMGFPVPASSSEVSLSDGLYYFAKSKGTLDAGAFETTLTEFAVVADDSAKIVLADELESITEPGASAKIIAGILEVLTGNEESMSVFVSHLSELILENTTCNIRVDGIEASGLDADLNLIVDRSPRYNYVAKSTPELIVERLSKKTSGREQAFYEKLKKKFH
ncbi:helix-hairpin-helix domain-containing protein [Methanolobus halotolerans]|uniref:DNA-binding protein MutS2 n=1 Tax=Methanolobus halotolerans TaxID=2052935 RepID=A0A4E0PU19_9EURY|nr:helix-hairpin-helix domain-containing protein [Methanolobus halotolerans]TGC08166.1 DNA mismatch repair protein MutS [Methanolobus halotolerans]